MTLQTCATRSALVVVLLLCLSSAVAQSTAVNGDLIVHYEGSLLGFPLLALHSPGGMTKVVGNAFSQRGDVLLAPSGTLYVANSTAPDIALHSSDFQLIRFIHTTTATRFLAMDAAGVLYAGSPNGDITRYAQDGTIIDIIHVGIATGAEIAGGDLGQDQCTLYYVQSSTPRVRRFDLCRREQLGDLGSVGLPVAPAETTLRVANDGAVLVASGFAAYRFSHNGIQTYPLGERNAAIAPTADARSFWSGFSALTLFDVDTGAGGGRTAPTGAAFITSLEIVGAYRASIAAGIAAIPATSDYSLVMLVCALLACAMHALRGSSGTGGH